MMFLLSLFITSSWSVDCKLALWNDAFSISSIKDDNGFTNDLEIETHLRNENNLITVKAFHRMITERRGFRRVDEGNLIIKYSRIFQYKNISLTIGSFVGLVAVGNLGGAIIQNSIHHIIKKGRTIESGELQTIYPEDTLFSPIFGAASTTDISVYKQIFLIQSNFLIQQSFGRTGLNEIILDAGPIWNQPIGDVIFIANAHMATSYFTSNDVNLSLPGGYVMNIWHITPHFGVAIKYKSIQMGWEQRFNEGGSQHATGIFYLQIFGSTS